MRVNLKDLLQRLDLQRTKRKRQERGRKQSDSADEVPTTKVHLVEKESLLGENIDFEYPASLSPADADAISKADMTTQSIKVLRNRRENISLTKQLVPKTAQG